LNPSARVSTTGLGAPATRREVGWKLLGVFASSRVRTRITFAIILFVSICLSLTWLVREPFFQSPDENAHADYAFTLFTARGLITERGHGTGTDTNPLIRYLEVATGYRTMRHNLDGRVPHGYGTVPFFRAIDAAAPHVGRDYERYDNGRIPFVATIYSYFYYVLEALMIALGAGLSGGSITIEFLLARLFNVLLLACTLTLSFATFRELRLSPRLALTLTAAIGLFPLTSWMSAYIQPDNLSFAAVSLAFYLSVRLRSSPRALQSAALLGLALGLLSLTKAQYFVAVGMPIVLNSTLRFARRWSAWPRWIAFCCLLLGPAAVGVLSVEAITARGDRQIAGLFIMGGDPIGQAFLHGLLPLLGYLGGALTRAWISFFYSGFTFYGFWGEFSWERVLISFGSPQATALVFAILAGASFIVGALLGVRLIFRVIPGLVGVARGRGFMAAARLAAADVPLNAYAIFLIIMLGINVASDGAAAGEGRYWLPFMLPMLLCAVVVAPRVLPRRLATAAGLSFATGALVYAAAAAIAAQAALTARFYEPLTDPRIKESLALIRRVGPYDTPAAKGGRVLSIARSGRVRVEGVAIDSGADLPASRVMILLDGKVAAVAPVGLPEPRVAGNMADRSLLRTGFVAWLDLRSTSLGRHRLSLAVPERSRTAPYPSASHVDFNLTDSGSQ
jgi:hypothetical protein